MYGTHKKWVSDRQQGMGTLKVFLFLMTEKPSDYTRTIDIITIHVSIYKQFIDYLLSCLGSPEVSYGTSQTQPSSTPISLSPVSSEYLNSSVTPVRVVYCGRSSQHVIFILNIFFEVWKFQLGPSTPSLFSKNQTQKQKCNLWDKTVHVPRTFYGHR